MFSKDYIVRKLTLVDIPKVHTLCKKNTTYYKYMKSQPTIEKLQEELTVLPPGKSLKDKFFVGYFQGENLVAVLDLVEGFPTEEIAYIGWFIMEKDLQGTGIGTRLMQELMHVLKEKEFTAVQLGVIKENVEALRFWKKLGFELTGKETDAGEYMVLGMKCIL